MSTYTALMEYNGFCFNHNGPQKNYVVSKMAKLQMTYIIRQLDTSIIGYNDRLRNQAHCHVLNP